MRRLTAYAIVFGSALVAMRAHAGNDDEFLLGNRAAMTGGAVSANVADASATWYNPAGLGGEARDQIDVSGTVYALRSYTVPRFISATNGASQDGSVLEFVTVPTQIALLRRLSENWTLGIGYFAPRLSNFVLREGLDLGDASQGSQWQVAATVSNAQHVGAIGVGSELLPGVRVGMSLIGGYAAVTQSISLFGAVSEGGATRANDARTALGTVSRLSVESALGAQIDLSRDLRLAITVRTPRLQLYQDTDVSNTESYASNVGASPVLIAFAMRPTNSHAGINVLRWGRMGAGLSHRLGDGFISAEVDFQPGLHRAAVDVDRKAVVNARLGVFHPMLPSVAFGAGIFTDRSSDAQSESLLSGSGDFYGGTLGVEISNKHALAPGEPTDALVFTSVFALRYAFSQGDFGRVVVDSASLSATEPFRSEHGVLRVHEMGLYVGGGLHF